MPQLAVRNAFLPLSFSFSISLMNAALREVTVALSSSTGRHASRVRGFWGSSGPKRLYSHLNQPLRCQRLGFGHGSPLGTHAVPDSLSVRIVHQLLDGERGEPADPLAAGVGLVVGGNGGRVAPIARCRLLLLAGHAG